MSEDLEKSILSWVSEALELRHGAAEDPEGSIPVLPSGASYREVNHVLYRVRSRSDRVDALLAKATQARSRAIRNQESARFDAEYAYDLAMQKNVANNTREFVTSKEKHADAALDSFEQRRAAHKAARLVSVTEEAYEVIKQVHWQLADIRKDLRATLHSLQFESSLER